MQFYSMSITNYSFQKPPLKGSITFSGEDGKIEINLSEDQIERIFDIVKESLIEFARERSKAMEIALMNRTAITHENTGG